MTLLMLLAEMGISFWGLATSGTSQPPSTRAEALCGKLSKKRKGARAFSSNSNNIMLMKTLMNKTGTPLLPNASTTKDVNPKT